MKRLYLLLFASLSAVASVAQQRNNAYDFLNIGNSARVVALGDSWVPFSDADIQFAANNPASVSDTLDGDMSLSYINYFNGMNFATVQYAKSFEKAGNFVGTVQYHNYGRNEETTESGQVVGEFSAADYSLTLGWGRALSEKLNIGANLKMAVIQYDIYTGMALGVDLSALYKADNGWVCGTAIRNVGGELFNNYRGKNCFMPTRVQIGASKKLEHLPFRLMVVYDNVQKWKLDDGAVETNTNLFGDEYQSDSHVKSFVSNLWHHFIVGGELNLGHNLAIRGSYDSGRRYEMLVDTARGMTGFSFGVGLHVKRFTIDYACSIQHVGGAANFITISSNMKYFK